MKHRYPLLISPPPEATERQGQYRRSRKLPNDIPISLPKNRPVNIRWLSPPPVFDIKMNVINTSTFTQG